MSTISHRPVLVIGTLPTTNELTNGVAYTEKENEPYWLSYLSVTSTMDLIGQQKPVPSSDWTHYNTGLLARLCLEEGSVPTHDSEPQMKGI